MACMSLGFRSLPPQSSISISSSSSSSSSSLSPRRAATSCSSIRSKAAAAPPMPPLNPKDPFLTNLASIAAVNPDLVAMPPSNSEIPPFLDLFDSPKLMATPAQVERSVSYNEHRPRKPPPDLPSLLLHGRVIYIGMPVGMEIEGFAIYDAMMQLKNELLFFSILFC